MRRKVLAGLLAAAAVAAVGAAQERLGMQVWRINADGTEGILRIAARPGGELAGTLLGHPVRGRLAGRRITLERSAAEGAELWEGWVATPGASTPMMAGTFVPAGGGEPRPWFALLAPPVLPAEQGAPPAAAERPPATAPAAPPVQAPAPLPEARKPEATAAAPHPSAPRLLDGRPDLRGVWRTPSGPLEIRQEGSRLTFVLPDREVGGRITGPETVIAGFAPGCCKGRLEEGFTVIAWDDGTRWYREP